jgi:hypothetical protein
MMKLDNNQKLIAEIVPVYKVQFVLFDNYSTVTDLARLRG